MLGRMTRQSAGQWEISPVLGVADVLEAVDYYAEQLGFERPEHVFGSEAEKVYAIVRRGGAAVHLQIRRQPDDRERGTHDSDGYVFVPDACALRDEYADKGVNITRDLEPEPYGLLDFSIETPFGHRLTFGSELDPADIPAPREE
jgi:uncharacterized glyoxalase superfamily protein PhnB